VTTSTEQLPREDNGELAARAWPGGYPLYYVTADSGILCPTCARMAERENLINDPSGAQWHIVAADVNWEGPSPHCDHCWEGPSLYCDHCYQRIESAYADPEDR
jgi:hypothetical protein